MDDHVLDSWLTLRVSRQAYQAATANNRGTVEYGLGDSRDRFAKDAEDDDVVKVEPIYASIQAHASMYDNSHCILLRQKLEVSTRLETCGSGAQPSGSLFRLCFRPRWIHEYSEFKRQQDSSRSDDLAESGRGTTSGSSRIPLHGDKESKVDGGSHPEPTSQGLWRLGWRDSTIKNHDPIPERCYGVMGRVCRDEVLILTFVTKC